MANLIVNLKLAIKSLSSNLGRTALSVLGIVIGTLSVILVLAFGTGLENYVVGQVQSFGTDVVEVEIKAPKTAHTSSQNVGNLAGGTQVTTFKLEEAKKISKLSNVDSWYAGAMGQEVFSRKGENERAFIMGVTSGIAKADPNFKIVQGEMFSPEDNTSQRQVVVLGSKLKEELFGKEDAVGKTIRIKKQSYKVVGVLEERGSTGFFDFDKLAYLPLETLQKKILGTDYITFAIYKLKDTTKTDFTKLEIEKMMRDFHDIDDPEDDDFAVMSIAEAIDLLEKVFTALDVLLLAITSISLVVGGVGITNVMYVGVTERSYEIGLRKAVGARNSDILKQFLFEAIMLTFLGGLVGVLFGFLASRLAEKIAASYGFLLDFPITFWSVALGTGFSIAVGIVFGLRPAQKAAHLSPVEALLKEE